MTCKQREQSQVCAVCADFTDPVCAPLAVCSVAVLWARVRKPESRNEKELNLIPVNLSSLRPRETNHLL